jgi:hypothetical protein
MAEHDPLNDRELTAALAALAPRRSCWNQEELFYRAGRAAAEAEHRRGRRALLTSMAAGWLTAALSLGLWSAQPASVIESTAAVPIDAGRTASREERATPSRNAVPGTTSLAPAVTAGNPASRSSANPGGQRILAGYRFDAAADLQHISRTGRLVFDRPQTQGIEVGGETGAAGGPATYRELMRELANRSDLL